MSAVTRWYMFDHKIKFRALSTYKAKKINKVHQPSNWLSENLYLEFVPAQEWATKVFAIFAKIAVGLLG